MPYPDEFFPEDVPYQPELVTCDREGDLAIVTIQRPEVMNCLSFPTLKRMRKLLFDLKSDLSIRAVLITGAGPKAFCAGADLKERRTMAPEGSISSEPSTSPRASRTGRPCSPPTAPSTAR